MQDINLTCFKELVQSRIEKPQKYNGETIHISDCDTFGIVEGILEDLIKKGCEEYNRNQPEKDQVGYHCGYGIEDDFTSIEEKYSKGVFLNESRTKYPGKGFIGPVIFESRLQKIEKEFCDNHIWKDRHLPENWVLFFCCQWSGSKDDTSYILRPTIDEWSEYLLSRYHKAVCQPVITYVRNVDIMIFHEDPKCWMYWTAIISKLEKVMEERQLDNLVGLSKEEYYNINKAIKNEIKKDILDKFFEWLHSRVVVSPEEYNEHRFRAAIQVLGGLVTSDKSSVSPRIAVQKADKLLHELGYIKSNELQ